MSSTQLNALSELTMDLHSRRIQLWIEDVRLRWRAPRGSMTVHLLKRIKALESALVEWLGGERMPDSASGVQAGRHPNTDAGKWTP